MSETQVETTSTIPFQPDPEKRGRTEATLMELLRLMQFAAKHEIKEGPDGALSVALFPEGEFPGIFVGRRSHVVEALQFILNKVVNRFGTDRRWISLGVGGHPPPRSFRAKRATPPAIDRLPAEAPAPREPRGAPQRARAPMSAPPPPPVAVVSTPDETTLSVEPDKAMTGIAHAIASKAAQLGRFYAISPMKPEERAQLLKGAQGVTGVRVYVEGEGRNRRIVFAPEKPAPMPRRAAYPHDDDLEG